MARLRFAAPGRHGEGCHRFHVAILAQKSIVTKGHLRGSLRAEYFEMRQGRLDQPRDCSVETHDAIVNRRRQGAVLSLVLHGTAKVDDRAGAYVLPRTSPASRRGHRVGRGSALAAPRTAIAAASADEARSVELGKLDPARGSSNLGAPGHHLHLVTNQREFVIGDIGGEPPNPRHERAFSPAAGLHCGTPDSARRYANSDKDLRRSARSAMIPVGL